MRRTGSELPKNMMKMKALIKIMPEMVAHLYPIRLVMGPTMKMPIKAPIGPACVSADCQGVGITYPWDPPRCTPYRFWKAGSAIQLPIRPWYDSMT
jgi:hypothetical protein